MRSGDCTSVAAGAFRRVTDVCVVECVPAMLSDFTPVRGELQLSILPSYGHPPCNIGVHIARLPFPRAEDEQDCDEPHHAGIQASTVAGRSASRENSSAPCMSDNMRGAEAACNTGRRESDPHPVVEMLLATAYRTILRGKRMPETDRSGRGPLRLRLSSQQMS